jgi:acetyl esterase/lipase
MRNTRTSAFPPTTLIHASDDDGVPIGDSVRWISELASVGVPATLFSVPRGGHGFEVGLENNVRAVGTIFKSHDTSLMRLVISGKQHALARLRVQSCPFLSA